MKTFAIIENNKVLNLAVAEDIAILGVLIPEAELVLEVTPETGAAYIGADFISGRFKPIQSFASWTFDKKLWAWVAPKTRPDSAGILVWDEELLDWTEITPPTEVAE